MLTLIFNDLPANMGLFTRRAACLCIAGMLLCGSVSGATGAVGNNSENSTARNKLEKIVVSRLAFYASHFPDMDFVVLDTAGSVEKNMHALYRIVGEDPVPLDYAHPEHLRHALLMSTYIRIQILLQTDVGSATLFAPGKGAIARRKQVCIVTLNPWVIAKNDAAATRHLLDLPEKTFDEIPRSRYLEHTSYLLFALDHEIYHCLDTSFNGPIPMSQQTHWGDYQMRRNEDGADAFAVLMQMKSHGRVTADTRTLKLIRGLTLLGKDPDHYTYPAIEAALQVRPIKSKLNDVQSCFRVATRIRNSVVGSYTDFLRFAAAEQQAMIKLGVSLDVCPFDSTGADPAIVDKLISKTRDAYRKLTGHPLPIPVSAD